MVTAYLRLAASVIPCGSSVVTDTFSDLQMILDGVQYLDQQSKVECTGQSSAHVRTLQSPPPPQARLGSGPFQAQWKALAVSHTYQEVLSPATVTALAANNHRDFCSHMTQAYINTMASGGTPPTYK